MSFSRYLVLASAVALVAACSGGPAEPDAGPIEPDNGALDNPCPEGTDEDGDTIPNDVETPLDADGDGLPNLIDLDSDNDSFPDIVEAGDTDCSTPPPDLDGDGIPDFLDADANADGVNDRFQIGMDSDNDGVEDYLDDDTDADGIPNVIEFGPGEAPLDTDGDGTPNVRDLDSDGDFITDQFEGLSDVDLDEIPNYVDTDSDGDGVLDVDEAGDRDLDTPPRVCLTEVDPESGEIRGDGFVDFLDRDSDNDGLGDGDEARLGTDPCDQDSDDDGFPDVGEAAFEQFNCDEGVGIGCGCAADPECGIPEEFFLVILPFGLDEVERDLTFSTAIQVADVMFLSDITGSMGGTISNVKATIADADGLITRITEIIPQAWFGGGTFQDFPFMKPGGGNYGGGSDNAFSLVVQMTPSDQGSVVQTAWNAVTASGGADGPESHTEALFQAITGQGGRWNGSYSVPDYQTDCLGTGYGAACFRNNALPIFILFTDICAHEGPPGEDDSCDPYEGISPSPANWTQTVQALNMRGAKFIGINATSGDCESGNTVPNGFSPCFFLRRTAEATESIDNTGTLLVYNLPNGADRTEFVDQVAEGVEIVATLVPIDVSTATRDDESDEIDAQDFIIGRVPACSDTLRFPSPTCWEEPPPPSSVTFDEAVEGYDDNTFFAVLPGTRVTFRVTFRNTVYRGTETTQVFLAFIDVVGSGGAVLDTRQVYIVVPAESRGGLD